VIVVKADSPVSSRDSAHYFALGTVHMISSYRTKSSANQTNVEIIWNTCNHMHFRCFRFWIPEGPWARSHRFGSSQIVLKMFRITSIVLSCIREDVRNVVILQFGISMVLPE